MATSERAHGIALAELHAAVVLFGFAGLFGKWTALSPLVLVLGRTLIAAASLAVVRALRRDARAPFDARLAANGVVLAVHWWTFFAAIQRSSVAIGLLGHASFPLFVLILERVLRGRRWRAREAACALLVSAGLVVLVPDFSWSDRAFQGLAFGVAAGFTFALLAVMNATWAASRPAIDVAFWQNAWAAMTLLVVVVAIGEAPAMTAHDAAALVALGVVCTAGAHTLFIASLKRVSAHTASIVAALEPVYGIVLAWLLVGEMPGVRTIAGAALIVGAALVATRRAGLGERVESPG